MSGEKELLLSLPLDNKEREWMKERLRTLSVREEYQLAAAVWRSDRLSRLASQDRDERLESVLRQKPEDLAREAVNCLLSLEEYNVLCPAGSYESLGECYLKYYTDIPPEAWLFMDLEQIGENYESCHPGLFIGGCYVSYPRQEPEQLYRGTDLESLPKGDWSLRLRLASPANPEGIWLRLPDYSPLNGWMPGEVEMALQALSADSPQDCTLLEAQCIIPELQESAEQYEDLEQLIRDGNDLGYVLDEQGQGQPHFLEKYFAAMELEQCDTIAMALDIAQNLNCYDMVLAGQEQEYGLKMVEQLITQSADPVITPDCVRLKEYGLSLLGQEGYVLNAKGTAYIRRNSQEFYFEHTAPRTEPGVTMN